MSFLVGACCKRIHRTSFVTLNRIKCSSISFKYIFFPGLLCKLSEENLIYVNVFRLEISICDR